MNNAMTAVAVSLKNRIVLLTCAAALVTALAIGTFSYFQTEAIVYSAAAEQLPSQTTILGQRLSNTYKEMRTTATILAEAPPVLGIYRSVDNRGVDPFSGTSTQLWRQQLEEIFATQMRAYPLFMQIRYIGIADGGLELVRVNRNETGPNAVPVYDLQEKGEESYFKEGLALKRGQILYSDITNNRENGRETLPLEPMLRVVLPVFDETNAMFGMIVVNVRYADLTASAFSQISPKGSVIVANSKGDYAQYSPRTGLGPLHLQGAQSLQALPVVREVMKSSQSSGLVDTEGAVSYFVRVGVNPSDPTEYLNVISRISFDGLMASTWELRTKMLMSGALLLLVCLMASWYIARKFTAPLHDMTMLLRQSDGRHVPNGLPLTRRDEIGDLARAFARKTRELADMDARASAVVDHVIDGLITIDAYGIVDSYNPACERIFGYARDEVMGKNVSMLMPEPHHSAHDGYLAKYAKTGKKHIIGATRELEGRRKDGSLFPLELAVSEIVLKDKRYYSGVIRDISERKQMEIMKDEFVSTVSHELRTPLTAIRGALGLLVAKSEGSLDEKSTKLLRISSENCDRLSRLVNDILDIEKISAGKLDYRFEECEIGEIVASVVDSQTEHARTYEVELVLSGCDGQSMVNVDQDRLIQALVNLISNATHFSPHGGVVDVSVEIIETGSVRVAVKDQGPGIPDEFRSKIFQKFAQADSSDTRLRGGSGLGLSITKDIIETFGGTIGFNSVVGEGSTFYFDLPVRVPMQRSA